MLARAGVGLGCVDLTSIFAEGLTDAFGRWHGACLRVWRVRSVFTPDSAQLILLASGVISRAVPVRLMLPWLENFQPDCAGRECSSFLFDRMIHTL
jgi:hypothetical protein